MYIFHRTGRHITKFIDSIILFFVFLGHLSHSIKDILLGKCALSWFNVVRILFYSGAVLVIPLFIICFVISMSLSINAYSIFSRFNLQANVLDISQNLLTQDILPLLIGFVLCVQSSLNMINARIKITKLRHTPHEVVIHYILPIMIGMDITALLLYIYTFMAIFVSFYLTFHYFLNVPSQVFFMQLGRSITTLEIFYSIIKTLLYCTIVSLTAGYYYYEVAVNKISLRKAVSRIFTRGSLWLTIISAYWKLMNFY